MGYHTVKAQGRTSTGLLLMVLGLVIAAIPFVGGIGGIILLIGVILTYLGASAYGMAHRRFVKWSIILWILIAIITVIAAVGTLFQLFAARLAGATREDLIPLWTTFVVAVAVGAAAFSVPYFLITYQLQDRKGRAVLWGALAIHVVAVSAYAWLLSGLLDALLTAVETQAQDPTFLLGNPSLQGVLAVSNVVWAAAYYLAYRRVTLGKVSVSQVVMP
jgi:hypothetical protein